VENDKYLMNFKKLGLKIAYYRKLRGYTQEKLAEQMGVATSYIGAIEAPNMNKRISLTTLFVIAEMLDTPAWKFLDFD
jgi:transcriptional regulator with XRE-family HTH domain